MAYDPTNSRDAVRSRERRERERQRLRQSHELAPRIPDALLQKMVAEHAELSAEEELQLAESIAAATRGLKLGGTAADREFQICRDHGEIWEED